jgi:hypothetical protein
MWIKNNLFSIPVYKTNISSDSFDKEIIVKTIENNYLKASLRNNFDNNSDIHLQYEDENNKIFDKINYKKINMQYEKIFNNFFSTQFNYKKTFKYEFFNCNYTAGKKNQFMSPHNHLPNSDFSCVHYLKLSKKNENYTTFINSNDFSDYFRYLKPNLNKISDLNNIENSYMSYKFSLKVEENDFIIFPSILKHMIEKINSDDLRITIVTDVILKENN